MATDYTKLQARWSKRENDILYSFPNKWDGSLLNMILSGHRWGYDGKLGPSFIEELEKRGYDIKTLRFSIQLKPPEERELSAGGTKGTGTK